MAGFMAQATIAVRGRGRATATPDGVELFVTITALEAAPDRALAAVWERDARVRSVLDQLGIPSAAASTARASVDEEFEYERQTDRKVHRGYRATSDIALRLSDAEPVGRFMRMATERADVRIRGPWWRVDPDNASWGDACAAAATDARRKAESYANALVHVGGVLEVSEPGIVTSHEGMHVAASASGRTISGRDLPVSAGELEVDATVDVTFALKEG
jgi:uncharacterized protein YggE